jgi:transcriptional regulator with PAS, ATPase and Fis domain
MPVRLLESEIFGYPPGMSGAEETEGAIGVASNGTLFLDEIGETDADLQQRLIQTFQDSRHGTQKDSGRMESSARFVCASNMDLDSKAVENPLFAELLGCFSYRVRLLPLRERKRDLPRLCEYLAEKFARNFGRPVPDLSPSVLEAFGEWDWPGNIRELGNWIARIVIFGTEEAMQAGARQRARKIDAASRRHRATRIRLSSLRRSRRDR